MQEIVRAIKTKQKAIQRRLQKQTKTCPDPCLHVLAHARPGKRMRSTPPKQTKQMNSKQSREQYTDDLRFFLSTSEVGSPKL